MYYSAIFASILLFAGVANASVDFRKLNCIASIGGENTVKLETPRTHGMPSDSPILYQGSKIAIGFYDGWDDETHQTLSMSVDGTISIIQNPSETLYLLISPKRIQIRCDFLGSLKPI